MRAKKAAWQILAYRHSPLHYSGTERHEYATEHEADVVARCLRRQRHYYFCVEVLPPPEPAYFWLGADAEAT